LKVEPRVAALTPIATSRLFSLLTLSLLLCLPPPSAADKKAQAAAAQRRKAAAAQLIRGIPVGLVSQFTHTDPRTKEETRYQPLVTNGDGACAIHAAVGEEDLTKRQVYLLGAKEVYAGKLGELWNMPEEGSARTKALKAVFRTIVTHFARDAAHGHGISVHTKRFFSTDALKEGIATLHASYGKAGLDQCVPGVHKKTVDQIGTDSEWDKLFAKRTTDLKTWRASVDEWVSKQLATLFNRYLSVLRGEELGLNYYLSDLECELIALAFDVKLKLFFPIQSFNDLRLFQSSLFNAEKAGECTLLCYNGYNHFERCVAVPLVLESAGAAGPAASSPTTKSFSLDALPGKVFTPVETCDDGACAIHAIIGRMTTEEDDQVAAGPVSHPEAKKEYTDRLLSRRADLRADSESELPLHFARLIEASLSSSSKGPGATLLYGAEANAMGRELKKKYDDLLVTLKDQDKADYPDLSLCPLFRRMISETAWLDHYLQTVQNEKYCLEANEVPIIALLFNVHVTKATKVSSGDIFPDKSMQFHATGATRRTILYATNHFWACRESDVAISSAPVDSMEDEEGKGGEKEHDGKEDKSKRINTKIRKANQQGGTTAKRAKKGSTAEASDATASAAGTAAAAAASASRHSKRKTTTTASSDPIDSTPTKKSRTRQSFASCFFDFWRAKHCTFSL
jgi:hypothetical protein